MKKVLLLIVATSCSLFSFSQISFSHSLGGGVLSAGSVGLFSAFYSPRVNIAELSDELSVSVGSHLGIGFSFQGSSNSRSGSSSTSSSFGYDIPIVAELNYGCKNIPDNESTFGLFVGAGGGYSSISTNENGISASNTSYGFYGNGGVRFFIKETIPIELRASYLLNVNSTGTNVLGINAAYIF